MLLLRILLLVTCVLSPTAWSQHYPTQTYTEVDGLPSSAVQGITQLADGRLAFSTFSGLTFFDGVRWEHQQLPGEGRQRQVLLLPPDGGPLHAIVRSAPNTLMRFDGARWEALAPDLDADSRLTWGAARMGPNGFEALVVTWDVRLWLLRDGTWLELEQPATPLVGLAATDAGFFWATRDEVRHFDGARETALELDLPGPLCGLTTEPDGGQLVLLGTRYWGTCKGPGRPLVIARSDLALQHAPLDPGYPCAVTRTGDLYVASSEGIFAFRADGATEALTVDKGLADNGALALFVDRENLIWIGGARGLTKFPGFRLRAYTRDHGLAEEEITAVIGLPDGDVLLGHPRWLTRLGAAGDLAAGIVRVPLPSEDPYTRVMRFRATPEGKVLMACARGGWMEFDPATNAITIQSGPTAGAPVADLLLAQTGALYALAGGRPWKRTAEGWAQLAIPVEIAASRYLRQIVELRDGRILVATMAHGIAEVGSTNGQVLRHPTLPAANMPYTLHERPDGELWVGTLAGLVHADANGELAHLELGGQRIERPVYFITEDADQHIWFGTDNGLYEWTGKELLSLSVQEGFFGAETNRGAHWLSPQGELWVGTNTAVNVIAPRDARTLGHPPTLALVGVSIAGQAVPLTRPASRTESREGLAFDFRTISFVGERSVQHRAFLEGFDDDWTAYALDAGRRRAYPSLAPGRYRLHLQAKDVLGRESAIATSEWLTVRPPLWVRPWFAAIVLLLFLGVGYAIYEAFVQKRLSTTLEGLVAERTRQLNAEKRRLEATLASIADGVVALDSQGHIRLWSNAAEQITGWPAPIALGSNFETLLERRPLPTPTEVSGAGAVLYEVRMRSGEKRTVECTHATIPLEGSASGEVIAIRDVTERLVNERARSRAQQLEALGMLAGGIAHDFNNLLTVILGNLTLLERDASVGTTHPQVHSISSAVEQARSLTQQLLTFSKGGEPIQKLGHLGPVVRNALDLVLADSNVQLDLDLPSDLPPVLMDASQIAQVVHNLALNASQAVGPGGRLRVSARVVEGARFAEVVVQDNGPGIAPELQEQVFAPYFSTKKGGTGLGLATAHSIAVRHGGTLTMESAPGVGTTFMLRLPLPAERVEPLAQPAPTPPSASAPHVRSILVMDDEEPVRQVLRSMVEQLGFLCVTSASGEEALREYTTARANNAPFDLTILDLTVPHGMGGQATMEALLELDPAVRAIAMSGYAHEPIMARPRDYGFLLALPKPYGIAEVRAAIERALGESVA